MAIINPLAIYLFYVVGCVGDVLKIVLTVYLVFLSAMILIVFIEGCEERAKLLKKNIVVALILTTIAVLIPTKEIMLQMFVAKSVTKENVAEAKDVASKVYNDILSVINKK